MTEHEEVASDGEFDDINSLDTLEAVIKDLLDRNKDKVDTKTRLLFVSGDPRNNIYLDVKSVGVASNDDDEYAIYISLVPDPASMLRAIKGLASQNAQGGKDAVE